jgi:DNA-binding NarL/FixJ family response regulator
LEISILLEGWVSLRLLLADDHQILRQGLRTLLELAGLRVIGEASNGREAVRLASREAPDVCVLEVSMPELNGIDAAIQIMDVTPGSHIVLLTARAEEHRIVAALRAGVRGYVMKTQAVADLIDAIREVAAGGMYLSPVVSGILAEAYLAGSEPTADPLTSREREILQLIAEGKTTKEIGTLLNLTRNTAESYRARLMEKLNIHHTAGLVRYAIRRGLVQAVTAGMSVLWDLPVELWDVPPELWEVPVAAFFA